MSINTDARTISDVSLTSEYKLLEDTFHWKKANFLRCNLEAIEHAFTSEQNKTLLREKLIAGYK
jgi:adenosine deaminase